MYRHILIATDGSELSAKAVDQGLKLAKAVGARVTTLTVTEPFHTFTLEPDQLADTPAEYQRHVQQRARRILAEAAGKAQAAGVACDTVHVEHEHPYQAIIDAATARGCDLIAMASHGRRGVSAVVLGSETLKVLTHCSLPVIVYR